MNHYASTENSSLYLTEANLTKLSGLFRAQEYPDPYVTVLCLEGTARELSELSLAVLGSVCHEGMEQETAHLSPCSTRKNQHALTGREV